MDKEPFIYTISSEERINVDENGPTYNINFGGFNSQYDNFKCEVMSCTLSNSYRTTLGFFALTARNLSENGRFCPNILDANVSLVAIISTNAVTARHDGEMFFNVKNCRIPRMITFTMVVPNFTEAISGTDINSGDLTRWILVLKMTPID